MMTLLTITLLVALTIPPLHISITKDGGLKIDNSVISLRCRTVEKEFKRVPDERESPANGRKFCFLDSNSDKVFEGSVNWKQETDGSVSGEYFIDCLRDVETQDLSPNISFPNSDYPDVTWTVAGETLKLGEKGFFKSATVKSMDFALPGAKHLVFNFENPTYVVARDYRKKSGKWLVRFGMYPKNMTFLKGDSIYFKVNLSSTSGIELKDFQTYDISESGNWVTIENCKDVVSGSALDFSHIANVDGPSGKYGWLKAKNGGFYFDNLPDVPQYFIGANLCMSANFVNHALADTLVERFIRLGYNAVRVHHHDRDLHDDGNWDNLDYLISKLIERGMYITTDLFVSRHVTYSELGLEGKGRISGNLYKNLIPCYRPAFENWCKYSREFLEHVNPYTGRAYKDEPAIAMISLINEGKLTGVGDKNYPPLKAEWERFGGEGRLAYNSKRFEDFEDYLNEKAFRMCSEFVRSIGCKALLSNDNNGTRHGMGEGCTDLYDYVENHFYVDHPKFIGARYKLPSKCMNINLTREMQKGAVMTKDFVKASPKPYTLTEWNMCGPSRYRGQAGLVFGALASINGWDGLWRFAYSHTAADVACNPNSFPSTFNLATDPLNLASERATVCLFKRHDITDPAGLTLDGKTGCISLVSPRTCGMFRYRGHDDAGPLSVAVKDTPATLWVSSVDGKDIESSDRLILVHLTDVQGNGVCFEDDSRTVLLKWGTGTLIEKGSADISLKLDSPARYTVYELRGNGERVRGLKSEVKDGRLCFTVSTQGPSGGRMYYEIIKK